MDVKHRLYQDMLRIRMVEEAIAQRYAEQEMRCPVHLSIGQEGVAAGVCAALEKTDGVMSGHRSHAHYLAKGGDLDAMIAEIYGKATGCCYGRGGSMHLLDLDAGFLGAVPIVGSTIPILAGFAFAAKLQKQPRVLVSFFGEGATEEGVFAETLNFAVLHKLPMIFLCENNLYSVYSPMSVRQPESRDLPAIAQAHGAAALSGDGNDPLAVYELTREAVNRARAGEGPTFIYLTTYRWREHCGPNYDNHIGYRTEAEYQTWRAQDPLETFATRYPEVRAEEPALRERLTAEIDAAFERAKAAPFPDPATMMDFTTAEVQS